jgi:hypothetical protein
MTRITRRHALILGCSLGSGALLYDCLRTKRNVFEENARLSKLSNADIRDAPLDIAPVGDLVNTVPRHETRSILLRLLPAWVSIKTGRVLHAYRLWKADATFPPDLFPNLYNYKSFSGRELSKFLFDHRYFASLLPGESPLLLKTPSGVNVRNVPGGLEGHFVSTLGHSDDLLASCGEVGMSSRTEIWAFDLSLNRSEPATIADLVLESVARFTLRQELPWTAESLARYLSSRRQWFNRFGESCSFDEVVLRMLALSPGEGACFGTHTLNSLVCLLRLSEQCLLISGYVKDRVVSHLRQISAHLDAISKGGAWDGSWAKKEGNNDIERSSAASMLACTGHHLEWIAIAPPDLRPKQRVIESAISSVFRFLNSGWLAHPSAATDAYLDLSHLGRALCLLANRDPSFIVRHWA